MKNISLIAMLLLTAAAAFADEGERRTVIVRDGKVITDDAFPKMKRAFVGVAVTQMTPELREFFGAPPTAGVLVSSVSPNGPAAKAGLKVGDVIVAINGQDVSSQGALTRILKEKHAGDAVRMEYIRGKARQSAVATAEERNVPAFDFTFEIPDLPQIESSLKGKEWQAWVSAPHEEELRARMKELETRLKDLEKKLNKLNEK